jgi:hypothetical protein
MAFAVIAYLRQHAVIETDLVELRVVDVTARYNICAPIGHRLITGQQSREADR